MADGTGIAWTETEAELDAAQLHLLRSLFKQAKRTLPAPGRVRVPGATFNPWIGCSVVTEGCKFCYAAALVERFPDMVGQKKGLPVWGHKAPRRVTSAANWTKVRRLNALARAVGVRIKVFVASMADVFERFGGLVTSRPGIAPSLDAARKALWALIRECPDLDFLILTKRIENAAEMVPGAWWLTGWPRNVWIGCTAENQARAAERLPILVSLPAARRFVSHEPALEMVDFRPWAKEGYGLDWIITGGESGPAPRPYSMAWPWLILAHGAETNTPIFVKQMGGNPVSSRLFDDVNSSGWGVKLDGVTCYPMDMRDPHGGELEYWPADLRVQQFPWRPLTTPVPNWRAPCMTPAT
jgi:protein gp37